MIKQYSPEVARAVDEAKREALYDAVWKTLRAIAVDAAPGSITPETFSRVAVDVVLRELLRLGIVQRS